MILHDLTIRGFRYFADEIHLGPFNKRVTVVHAPNGNGKTTVLDALYHGLLEKTDLGGDRAKERIASIDRDLQAAVDVIFETDGVRYRVSKRFIKDTRTTLEREENGAFRAFQDGREAEDLIRRMLFASASGKGPMDRKKHFGLGTLLWAPQGTTAYTALPADLAARVNQQLHGEAAFGAPSDARVVDQVGAWYAHYWTASGKQRTEQGSANLPELREALAEAEAAFGRAATAFEAVGALRVAYEEACTLQVQGQERALELGRRHVDLRGHAGRYTLAQSELAQAQRNASDAQTRWSEIHQTVEALKAAGATIAETNAQLTEQETVAADLSAKASAATVQLTEHQAGLQRLTDVAERIAQDEECARNAARYLTLSAQMDASEATLRKCETAQAEVTALQATRNAILAPDAKALKRIRSCRDAVSELLTKLEAAVIHLEIEPTRALKVNVLTGTPSGGKSVSPGSPLCASGAPLVEIDIEGFGLIRARGPSESADEIRSKLAVAQGKVTNECRIFGTADIEELESRRERADELDVKIGRLQATLDAMLTDGGLEGLLALHARSAAERAVLDASEPSWLEALPDAVALTALARARREVYRTQLATQRAQCYVAGDAKVELDAALSAVRAEIAHSREKRAGAVGKVDQLSQDGHSDEERTRSLTRLALEWNAARGLLEAAESKRSAFVGDPSAELAALEAMIEQARQDQTDRLTAEVRAKTRLDGVVANGSYAEFARCDERRLVARQKAESGEHAAEAARILHQAIEAVRAEQRELVLVPVQARASALYARIAGARRADVRFDPKTFVPSGLGFNGQGIIDIGSTLSGGEEEQLHMVARLALADELATGERQFVVLDDSLALTDAVRFARFLAIIEEFSSDRMQFLIMTYDKTRYAALQDATFIDLRALRQGIALASAS